MSCSYKCVIPIDDGVLTLSGKGFYSAREARKALAEQLLDHGFRPPRLCGLWVQKELRTLPREVLNLMAELSR
ncbi:hypothetical protein ACVMB3_002814 [Sinorhizobium meliloti]